jgi:RNA polymerase sigma-70 factor (ECF subfamily)
MRKHMSTPQQQQELPDGVLAQLALVGDQWAFETLVQRYSKAIFGFIYHLLGDYDRACDILQQVFLQLYLSLAIIRTGDSLKPWLLRVARNRCLDDFRQQRRRAVCLSALEDNEEEFQQLIDAPDTHPLPEEIAEAHDLQRRLLEAISALPLKFRAVVFLNYSAQLSFPEIANILDLPTSTAKSRFQRAKLLLRAHLCDLAS